MQRILWLAFCLLVTTGVATQANASRYRDDGFNPMNMMSDMPGPMNVFDSSDRRRDRRRHRPPPPRPAPAFGYGGYPPYARPPVAPAPHAYPRIQQGGRPQPGGSVAGQPSPQTKPETAPVTKDVDAQQPRGQTPDYSFRPVLPAAAPTPTTVPGTRAAREESRQVHSQPAPNTRLLKPLPEKKPNEPILVNGKPAIFRPMEPGSTNNP